MNVKYFGFTILERATFINFFLIFYSFTFWHNNQSKEFLQLQSEHRTFSVEQTWVLLSLWRSGGGTCPVYCVVTKRVPPFLLFSARQKANVNLHETRIVTSQWRRHIFARSSVEKPNGAGCWAKKDKVAVPGEFTVANGDMCVLGFWHMQANGGKVHFCFFEVAEFEPAYCKRTF